MNLDSVVSGTKCEPRPYQSRIVQNAYDLYNGRYENARGEIDPPARSVLIESPTGSGKTVMALLAIKAMQADNPDLKVGWVAMRRNLLAQAEKENAEKGINATNMHYVSMFDKKPPEGLDMLVVDEAQHDAASSMTHLHNTIRPKMIMGMTATPFRTDRVKLCFDKVIKDAGINQLVLDGYLSKYDHFTVPKYDVGTLTEFYCREPERWGKSLFFFHSLEDCFALNAELRSRGVVSDVVTGDSDRDHQLEAFRNGAIPVLINCMVLTEGFDCPDLKTVFCRPSGRGCTVQMGGRVFRKHKSEPVKQIVQCLQTRWPFLKTVLPRQQYVWQSDSWRSLKVNPKMDLVSMNVLRAVAQTPVELPKYVTARNKVKKLRFNRE